MWEYLAVLLAGFWLGIAIFLYVSFYWVEEILDLPAAPRDGVAGAGAAAARDPSASGAHARLKRLVNRVIEEAMSLPALKHYAQSRSSPAPEQDNFDARTYEDLLATAILNKVIERYQTESTGGRSGGASSGIHSASASPTPSAPSSSSISPPHSPHTPPPLHDDEEDDHSDSEWEHHDFRGQDVPEMPRRIPFPEFGGDIIHCADGSSEMNDDVLEEMSGSDLQAVDGCWEENWLFQKKKVKTLQSVPVPMLVPNPIAEYRAMIGDRDADDTTDLSDALTDSEEEHEYKSDIGRTLQSKTVIGGKIPTGKLVKIDGNDEIITNEHENKLVEEKLQFNSSESQNTSSNDADMSTEIQEVTVEFNSSNDSVVVVGIDSGPLTKAEFAVGEIHRTLNSADIDEVDSFSEFGQKKNNSEINKENINSISMHEKEGEYEETTATPVQRYADSLRRQHYSLDTSKRNMTNGHGLDGENDLIPGSIADRERKKWLKCVDMPNNPYSTEAIQKRLSSKSTSALFDFLTTKSSIDEKVTGDVKIKEDKVEEKSQAPIPSPRVLKDILAEEVPQYRRYGRDYYINEAKRSAGARRMHNMSSASSLSSINKSTSLDRFDINDMNSPEHLIKKFNSLANGNIVNTSNKNRSVTTNTNEKNEDKVLIEYEDANEQSLFLAKPAYIEDDTDEKFDDILRSALEMSHQEIINRDFDSIKMSECNGIDESIVSSSSMEDSLKIYNVPSGEIVKTPRYSDKVSRQDNNTELDNNDNIVIQDKSNGLEEYVKFVSDKNDTEALVALGGGNMANQINNSEEFDFRLPNVKDLAKKFVKIDSQEEYQLPKSTPRRRKFSNDYELEVVNKSDPKLSGKNINYMHSLTARSISKEFREELKLSMATPIKVPGGANELPDGIDNITSETSRPGSPLPEPGTLKNKLAFFESLKF